MTKNITIQGLQVGPVTSHNSYTIAMQLACVADGFLRANCGREKLIRAEEAGKPSAKQATMQYAIGEPASWFIKLLFIVYLRRVDDHGLFKKISIVLYPEGLFRKLD